MASKIKIAEIKSFVGGINTFASATQVKDNETPDMLNITFTGTSAITKRQGFAKLTSTEISAGHKVQGIFVYQTDSVKEILYISNGKLYKYNGSGGSTQVTGGSFSSSNNVNGCQLGDRLYFADGLTPLCYYNGSIISTSGVSSAPTKIKQMIKFGNRLYANSGDNKDRVYYGGALGADGTATNTGNFSSSTPSFGGFLGFGAGKTVSGFAKKEASLYVFFEDQIQKIDPVSNTGASDALDHSNTMISNSLGTRSPRSIENIENDIGFMDSQYYFLGEVANYTTIRTSNISSRVSSLFSAVTQANVSDVAAIYYDKEQKLLISVQVGGENNNHIIGYDLPYKAWFYWDTISANSFIDYIDSSNAKHLYFGSDDSGASYVYELFAGLLDDGSAVSSYYKTKEIDMGKFNIEKLYQNWNLLLGSVSGSMTVEFYVDGVLTDTVTFSAGTTGTNDGVGTLPVGWFAVGTEGNYTENSSTSTPESNLWRWHTLSTSPAGTKFQFKFINNNADENFEVEKASVGFLELPYYKRDSEKQI